MNTLPRTAAVVLAAGQSRRMGRNKLLRPLDGKPVIRHVLDALAGAPLAEVVVVIGHEAPFLRAALEGVDARLVENPAYASGLASSLQAGVSALDARIEGAMIVLGDMPDMAPNLVERLIDVFSAQGDSARQKIVAPTCGRWRGHPVLWGRDFFPALLHETCGDSGAREVIERHADALIRVEVESDAMLNDLDMPEAWRRRVGRFEI